MKRLILTLGLLAVFSILLPAVSVESDYDTRYPLDRIHTYSFHPSHGRDPHNVGDPFLTGRMERALEAELIAAGFVRDDSRPDIRIVIRTRESNRREAIRLDPLPPFGRRHPRRYPRSVIIREWREDMAVVEFLAHPDRTPVWRGIATGLDARTPEKSEKQAREAARKLVKQLIKDTKKAGSH